MSSNKERGLKAWNAMKALGFTKTKVGKVVKRLFKLFDDNWEPIEEDNYRILIDAMLEDASNEPMPATTSQGVDEDPVALSHRGTNEDSGPHSSTWARQEYQHPHSSASASRYDVDVSDNESSLIKRPRMSSADRVHGRALQPASQAIMALPAVHQSGGHGEPSARVTRSKDKDLLLESPQGVLLLEESKPESEFDVRAASVDKRLNIGGSSAPESSGPSFQNWVVPYESELPSEQRPLHDVADISKGEERVRIPIKNDFTDESCPPLFYYIRKNLVFQSAYVNTSLARIGGDNCCAGCSGNCLLAPFPCACARSTADDFAYTPEGLLRTSFIDECIAVNQFPEKHNKFYCEACPIERYKTEASPDPCKGHLARRFIKECWSKCGCDMQCGNRVVQRGITCNLQVFFTSEGKGWGLRTQDGLPKGAFICEYVGEILTSSELHGRIVENAKNGKHLHQLLLDASWGPEGAPRDEEALCIDPTFYGNVGRFVNHRCHDANLVLIPVEVETPDHRYYHLALFTAKKVEASEELTWDYGIDFDATDSTDRAFRCMCGSQYCRDRKNSRKRARAAASRN
ncbi:histone-lysine N-methyltransferase SUVR4-like isoform X3 [Lolium rigidum]|uniref:histone-lysine N-methyltransferase SUVR4-like isoform X3 n=1 Tax=Lolium rigidum TaxID=89674 RepID=UPI001F5D8F7E|nr:histone-lysine N-methyltransferase SUVR4-like isoform X3 [Lolium rigidum]